MAEHLAQIFGTEKDRVNCPFYFKIGACRHGDRCSRLHNRPSISQTVLLVNMYQNPAVVPQPIPLDPRQVTEHFEDFYEDIFEEMSKYGEIENLNVCDNLADHLVGNVYVKFREEESAAAATVGLAGRFYAGRPIIAEYSPVTDFRESTCRQYEEQSCNRGGYCNFMHLKPVSRDLRKRLFGRYHRRDGHIDDRHRDRVADERDRRGGRDDRRGDDRRGDDRRGDDRRGDDRRRDDRRGEDRGRDREREARPAARESSAERRARIASWNKEKDPVGGGGGHEGGGGRDAPPAAAPPPPPGGW